MARRSNVLDLEIPIRDAGDHASLLMVLVDALMARVPDDTSEVTLTAEEARAIQFAAMLAHVAASNAVEAFEAGLPVKAGV